MNTDQLGAAFGHSQMTSALQTVKVCAACADLCDEFVEFCRAGITALSINHRLAADEHRLVAISFDLDRGFSPKLAEIIRKSVFICG